VSGSRCCAPGVHRRRAHRRELTPGPGPGEVRHPNPTTPQGGGPETSPPRPGTPAAQVPKISPRCGWMVAGFDAEVCWNGGVDPDWYPDALDVLVRLRPGDDGPRARRRARRAVEPPGVA
jgi:hypothetical protein